MSQNLGRMDLGRLERMSIPWEFLLQHSNPHMWWLGKISPSQGASLLWAVKPQCSRKGCCVQTAHCTPRNHHSRCSHMKDFWLSLFLLHAVTSSTSDKFPTSLPPKVCPQVFKEWMLLPKGSLKPGLIISYSCQTAETGVAF